MYDQHYQYDDFVPDDQQHGGDDDNNDSHMRFPVALEKALELKIERIKESGVVDEISGNY